MNILVIAPYNQADGWGSASKDYVRALAKTGHNISIKPIYLGHSHDRTTAEDLIELERKKCTSYDITLQLVLPPFLAYNGNVGKNVGFSFFETSNIQMSGWVRHINLMDAYFVASNKEKVDLVKAGVTIPVHVIGPVTNTEKYLNSYDKLPGLTHNSFKFYFIGEYSARKNLVAAVLAFHREFKRSENVDLVIKANIPGQNQDQVFSAISNDIAALKTSMKLYRNITDYKQETVITGHLSDEQICQIHQSCDCFVMPSYGESICRPALDAMGFGNPCIVTKDTGMEGFVNQKNGWLVKSDSVPVVQAAKVLDDYYTSYESWQKVDINSLQKAMRLAYNKNYKGKEASEFIFANTGYDSVAKRFNEVLCQI